jgi:hypothetical protein
MLPHIRLLVDGLSHQNSEFLGAGHLVCKQSHISWGNTFPNSGHKSCTGGPQLADCVAKLFSGSRIATVEKFDSHLPATMKLVSP